MKLKKKNCINKKEILWKIKKTLIKIKMKGLSILILILILLILMISHFFLF